MINEEGKPMIRHCENCRWYDPSRYQECRVKYKQVWFARIKALLCKYFKLKG